MIFLNQLVRIKTNHYPFNMIKKGDWIIVDGYQRKKCFGIHTNGNYLIKNEGSLAQVPKERVKTYA